MSSLSFVIIVSATTLLISFMWMYKLLGKNMILSLPGYFYIYFIVFIFLGSPFIFIKNGLDNHLYIISTHLVLIILPMSIYLVNKLMLGQDLDFHQKRVFRPIEMGTIPVTRYLVPGTWYLVPGTRYLVPGTRYLVPGTWYQVPGTRYQVPGTRYQVPGTRY